MLSESGFVQILTSAANDAADPQLTSQVVQDMGLPLSDYFIASSHNTYLTGDQLRSASGCEMYARCLLQGCRCVEIDCWDGPDGYPDVYHGYTVSTHLKMSDVIQVIAEHAFSASPYPLIISLEVHCSLAQQQTLATLLQQGLGEALYVPDNEARALKQLPSPEALRYKILLKAKTNELASEEAEAARADLAEGVGDDDKYAELKKGHGHSNAAAALLPEEEGGSSASPTKQRNRKTSFNISRDNAMPHTGQSSPALRRGGADVERFHPELCALVALKGRSKLRPERFSDPGGEYDPWQLSSIGELKSSAFLKDHGARWLRHNRCHLSRCFPKATRVDSSNMQPHPFWDAGSSMVALNYQTFDQPMQINQGKFRLNGGCGWVLKPVHLRGGKKAGWKPGDQAHKLTKLQIKLLGALHLTKPGQERMQREGWQLDSCPLLKPHELSASSVVNPQVTVEAYGGSFAAAGELLDACAHGDVWTSHTKQRNGLNPMWNEHVEVGISHPELAVLRFCVSDRQSAGGGTESARATGKDYCFATLPVAALRSGYRSLPLRDKNGCLVAFSTLLLHVRQTHTHLPPSLRKEERAGRHRAEGGAQFMRRLQGKSGAKGPSLEA